MRSMPRRNLRLLLPLVLAFLLAYTSVPAQEPESRTATATDASAATRPLPDVPALMHQVEQHQLLAEAVHKDYIYRSSSRFERLDKHGQPKDTDTRVTDDFYLDGVPVERLVEHNGKPLSPDEQKKESERIDREVVKAKARLAKAQASGKPTDAEGDSVITVSRLLELARFTNPRRVQIEGRPTIAVDFQANPDAKPHNMGESVIHDMAGTIWIDEHDRAIQHLEGAFVKSFKLGGGLVANVSQGTHFTASNVRINNEVWLPANIEAHGNIRFLLFVNIDGNFTQHNSDYRKFKVTSTIVSTTPGTPTPLPATSPDGVSPADTSRPSPPAKNPQH